MAVKEQFVEVHLVAAAAVAATAAVSSVPGQEKITHVKVSIYDQLIQSIVFENNGVL